MFFVSEVGAFASLAAALEALELSTQRKALVVVGGVPLHRQVQLMQYRMRTESFRSFATLNIWINQ